MRPPPTDPVAAPPKRPFAANALWAIHALVVLGPLVEAAVSWRRGWVPVGDNANIAIYGSEVGTRSTPLVGMPSGLGSFADTTATHPGPLVVWIIGPWVRVFGPEPLAVLVGSALVASASIAVGGWVAWRQARRAGLAAASVIFALVLVVTPYNLVQPLNPGLALLPTVVAFLAAWGVAAGDRGVLPVFVVSASLSAQSNSAYTPVMFAVSAALVVVALVRLRRRRARDTSGTWEVPPIGRTGVASVALAAGLWSGPVIDVLVHEGGNVRETLRFVGEVDVHPQGWSAMSAALWQLADPVGWIADAGNASPPRFGLLGLLVLVAVGLLVRRGLASYPGRCRALLAVAGPAVAATALSQGFTPEAAGRQVSYLLPVVAVGALCWFGVLWLLLERMARSRHRRRWLALLAVATLVTFSQGPQLSPLEPGSGAVADLADDVRRTVEPGRYLLVPGGGPTSQSILRGVGFLLAESAVRPFYPDDQVQYVGPRNVEKAAPSPLPRLVITRGDLATDAPAGWVRVASWVPPGRDPAELERLRASVAAARRAAGLRFTHQAGAFNVGQVLAACGRVDAAKLLDDQELISLGEALRNDPRRLAALPDLVIATFVEEQILPSTGIDEDLMARFGAATAEDALDIWLVPAGASR